MIRSAAMVAMTGDLPLWAPVSLKVGPFYPAEGGFDKYLAPFSVVGTPETGMHVSGPSCIPFLGQFGLVILWHWPHEDVIQAIRAASTAPHGTRIALAATYESINQRSPWDGVQNPLWSFLREHRIVGPKQNTFGELFVDYYESRPPGDKNHCWAVDISLGWLANTYSDILSWIMDEHYRRYRPDWLFLDCFQGMRFWGMATNPPASDPGYPDGWQRLARRVQGRNMMVLGHNAGAGYRDLLYGRIDEFFGSRSVSSAVNYITEETRAGSILGLGITGLSPWTTRARWQALGPVNSPSVYAVTARTGGAFRIFHPGTEFIE